MTVVTNGGQRGSRDTSHGIWIQAGSYAEVGPHDYIRQSEAKTHVKAIAIGAYKDYDR